MKDAPATIRDIIQKMEQWQKKLAKGEGVAKIAQLMQDEANRLKIYLNNTEQ